MRDVKDSSEIRGDATSAESPPESNGARYPMNFNSLTERLKKILALCGAL